MINVNGDLVVQTNSFIGEQQFLFNRDYDQSYTQSKIYIKAKDYKVREIIEINSYDFVSRNYPGAKVSVAAQQNIFEKIFSASESPLVVEVSLLKEKQVPPVTQMMEIVDKLKVHWPDAGITPPPLEDKILLKLDPDKLLLYDISTTAVYNMLKTSLNQNNIGELRGSNALLPIVLSDKEKQVNEIISNGFVRNKAGLPVPVSELVKVQRVHDYKSIIGGADGEYVPVAMNIITNKPSVLSAEIRNLVTSDQSVDVKFSGSLITGQKIFKELAVILAVSLFLLFFILAAQFESLTQPLIVLLEIPIDIAGALLLVKLWGGTINIMTMIGLVVMSGVIINDSILKVDTINNLRAEGVGLVEAIYTAGSRRLKPILMVAMASLFSTAPMLFSNGIGAELQRPMALALVGGMSLGTVVSLFFIPLAYWFIYRKKA
jgi:multidrug efflux pump subunit AcrB